ncbi:MAG: YwaF family protein [Candidatus Izimaplasma sp.]|nr:YwaF family protein [Candidatus Izimaplasma bacterium]
MTFWQNVPFSKRVDLFDFSHISFMVTVLIIVYSFVTNLDKIRHHKTIVRNILLLLSGSQIIVFYTWSIVELGFSLEAGLPIHMCRLSTLLGFYYLLTLDQRVFHVLFYSSVFAIVAIVMPVNVHPIFTHVVGWSYQISHIIILLVWIMGVYVHNYKPSYTIMNNIIISFSILYFFVWRFNYWVGSGEYFYIRSDVNRPFLNSLGDIPWIVLTIAITYLVMALMTHLIMTQKTTQKQLT